jgi:uncharacterized protein (DUF885 family)
MRHLISRVALTVGLFFAFTAVAAPPPALDPSVSPTRAVVDRYALDAAALERSGVRLSDASRERAAGFLRDRTKELEAVDFEKLDQDGRVDYLLLRTKLAFELTDLEHERKQFAEVAPLLPFAPTIVGLEAARRRMEPIDAEAAAKTLSELAKQVADVRKGLDERLKSKSADVPSKVLADRAARRLGELRSMLAAWHRFYDNYDPTFTWWMKATYPRAEREIDDYAKLIRTKIVGSGEEEEDAQPEPPAAGEGQRGQGRGRGGQGGQAERGGQGGQGGPVVGDPIGREALLDALAAEMIPYTPEELIEIANREFAWCDKEMKRAAEELGCEGDWHKALALVSAKHVKPGEQPALIKRLADEATAFVEGRQLVTVPPLCKEIWRMDMMSEGRQRVTPYFTGGEVISVSYPTADMAFEDKAMSLRGNNESFCRATVHHELIPGHHLQLFMADRYNTHRRIFRTPFLVEGWALYWEMRLWDLNFARNAEDRVGMLFWRAHRCARIIFSLKFHLGQMTAPQAIEFLVKRVGHEPRNATAEVRRSVNGMYPPLYQAAYMLGGLQLRELQKDLVGKGRMSDREFHDAVLRENAIPIEMIRAKLTGATLTRDWKPGWRFYGEVQ